MAHGQRPDGDCQTVDVSIATRAAASVAETLLPKVCSTLSLALLPALITFQRLEPNGHTGPPVIVMGFLAASDHCPGQDIPTIGTLHQHSPTQALFAGSRSHIKEPAKFVALASSQDLRKNRVLHCASICKTVDHFMLTSLCTGTC